MKITPAIYCLGYNPQSWDSNGLPHITASDADRTAFLFNLTELTKLDQQLNNDPNGAYGSVQTFNSANIGPTFGGGNDILVDDKLNFIYNYNYSYGPDLVGALGITGLSFSESLGLGAWNTRMEVFTIGPSSPVPIPGAVWLLGSGLAGLAAARRKKKA